MHQLILKAIALTLLVTVHASQSTPIENQSRIQENHNLTTTSGSMEMIDRDVKSKKKTGPKNMKASAKGKKTTKGASRTSGSIKEKDTDRSKKTSKTDSRREKSDRSPRDAVCVDNGKDSCNELRSEIESISDTPVKDAAKEEVDGTSLIGTGRRSTRNKTKSDTSETKTDQSEDQ